MRKIFGNIVSLLTSDVMNRATTFLIYALVARYLGDFAFGQISLALLLFYTFYVFASLGVRVYITREIARDPSLTDRYLVNGSLLILAASVLSVLALVIFVWVMSYELSTARLVLIVGLAIVPYALTTVCEAVFQAHERMHFIAYANLPHNVLKVAATIFLLTQGYGAEPLAVMLVVSYTLTFVLEWFFILRYISRPTWTVDMPFASSMIKGVLPFLGLESVIAIWASLNALILSRVGNEIDVAMYNAAMQVLVPVSLVLQSIVMSLFPMMCREYETGGSGMQVVYEDLMELLLMVTLPAVVGIIFLAEPILLLFYGNESFANATIVLQIVAWSLIPMALNRALGQVLLASLREKITLRIVIVNSVLSLIIGILLIASSGIIGAAIATVAARLVNLGQQYVPVSQVVNSVAIGKSIWKATLASLGMGLYLAAFAEQLGLWLAIPTGALVYGALLGLIIIWSHGGLQGVRMRYAHLRSK